MHALTIEQMQSAAGRPANGGRTTIKLIEFCGYLLACALESSQKARSSMPIIFAFLLLFLGSVFGLIRMPNAYFRVAPSIFVLFLAAAIAQTHFSSALPRAWKRAQIEAFRAAPPPPPRPPWAALV